MIVIETTLIKPKEDGNNEDFTLNLFKLEEYYNKSDKNNIITLNFEINL